jgi:REP element-mobilizing transposase RayT
MPTSLSKEHRKHLEKTTADARILAESACRAALENLAVHEKEYRSHMSVEQRLLRNRLRARGRALGDKRDERSGNQEIRHLIELAAYEHWHRLLFTRFLTENHLLITDEANGSVPVTLEECEELAPELGARDGQDLACRFASLTLPGVFRRDDPVLDLPIAINDQVELRKLLAALPSEAFLADDALGWTYQFWQAQRKDEVNRSGKKIGAHEISPVTQLFTEDYMVEFLLHNTLGAWWAGKLGSIKAATEEEARAKAALPARDDVSAISWTYLRFVKVAGASSSGFKSPVLEAPATTPDWNTLAIRKGDNLPHWSCNHAIYHVSFRLSDSIPISKREEWLKEREDILANARRQGRTLSEPEQKRLQYLYSEKIETYLDSGQGECWLARAEIAAIVENALKHFDGQRYRLHAYCVMPNHVHVIVEPANGNELEAIIHSWKSFTANVANKILKRTGQFWQHEPYDHIIRNEREYCFQLQYVWDNPDKAGITARRMVAGKVAGASSSGFKSPELEAPATILRAVIPALSGLSHTY